MKISYPHRMLPASSATAAAVAAAAGVAPLRFAHLGRNDCESAYPRKYMHARLLQRFTRLRARNQPPFFCQFDTTWNDGKKEEEKKKERKKNEKSKTESTEILPNYLNQRMRTELVYFNLYHIIFFFFNKQEFYFSCWILGSWH